MVADGLDYFAAPIFGSPIIGDILDSFAISMLCLKYCLSLVKGVCFKVIKKVTR
jgi:hypothetical protein